jgi:hypothetical protein
MDSNHSPAPASPPSSTPRRIRRDGWTIDRQVKFIMALNATGSVTRAAAAAGMSRESAYRLRDRPGHEDFARVWDAAAARKGHTPPAEGHTRGGRIAGSPSRKGHESHGPERFARHRPSCPLPRAPRPGEVPSKAFDR